MNQPMMTVSPEILLFIGGGVLTIVFAAILITLMIRAGREHDRTVSGPPPGAAASPSPAASPTAQAPPAQQREPGAPESPR